MNPKIFSNALGGVDGKYVEEAANYTVKKKKSLWLKLSAAAAAFALAAGLLAIPHLLSRDDGVSSYFVITAHAANGESADLSFDGGYFNSGTAKENILNVDMPLFNFSVRPSDLKANEALYSRFDISISYNGKVVDGKDEHIVVGFTVHVFEDQPWSYLVMGWFTEPTDIIITIIDKESREIAETITVNVKYLADRQEYELEIVELNTKYAEQRKAAEANNALMEYFYDQGYVTDYPAYFGGCYIKDNKLYVRLVSPTDDEMKKISDVLARYDEVVVYKNGGMSMSELQAYADKAANDLQILGYAVTSWYVDSTTGDIVIAVLEEDLTAASEWASSIAGDSNTPNIIIEKGAYTSAE